VREHPRLAVAAHRGDRGSRRALYRLRLHEDDDLFVDYFEGPGAIEIIAPANPVTPSSMASAPIAAAVERAGRGQWTRSFEYEGDGWIAWVAG
jgi:hypothetical protein